jgi:hypothetical protein
MTAVITQRLEVRFASKAGLGWCGLSVIASGMMFLFYQDRFISKNRDQDKTVTRTGF